jgi:hypothetical protein
MNSKSTYLEQDLVNIIASMTFRIPNYPSAFFEAGYRVEFMEKEFDSIEIGREVKFDIVLNNLSKNHSIGFECKSGSAEPEQLLKYSRLSSEELVLVGGVASNLPSSHTHDIAIVFNECNLIKIQNDTSIYDFTHISISNSPTEIRMLDEPFQDDDLVTLFSSAIEYPDFIHEVFRVGGQTPLNKYVKLIANELIALSVNGQETFSLDELACGLCSTIPNLYPARVGSQLKKEIEKKTANVLIEGCKYELKDYIEWNKKSNQGKLKKLKPGCKTSTYQSFRVQANEMSERLRLSGPIPAKYLVKSREDPNQLLLDIVVEEIEFV